MSVIDGQLRFSWTPVLEYLQREICRGLSLQFGVISASRFKLLLRGEKMCDVELFGW